MRTKGKWKAGWGTGITGPNCAFTVHIPDNDQMKYTPIRVKGMLGDHLIAILPQREFDVEANAEFICTAVNAHDTLKAKAELCDELVESLVASICVLEQPCSMCGDEDAHPNVLKLHKALLTKAKAV